MMTHQPTLEKSPSKIAIPECFLHNDSSSATSSRGGGGTAAAGAASASDLVTPPTLPLAVPQLLLGSPVASACSSDPCGALTPGQALHTPVSGPLESSSCGNLDRGDSIGEEASLLLAGAGRQRRSSGGGKRLGSSNGGSGSLRGKRESFTVLDCQSDYTQVWRCDVGDDGVAERKGMRRLPSIRNLLGGSSRGRGGGGDEGGEGCGGGGGGEGEGGTADLLDPLREMLLGDRQVIVTAGSGIRGDIVDGHVDRMQYARLKRDIQETCCGTDFVTMTAEEELAAVWRAVLRRTPGARGVLHLGDTFFGLATGAASAVEEYMRDDAAASLAHHVEAVRWAAACGGAVVLVERVAETLHEACELQYGVAYPRDDVLEAAALAELSDEGGAGGGSADDRRRRTAVFAFVSMALEKLVSPDATVLLDQHSSSSMGALVNRVDEDELVASFLEEEDEEEDEEEETNETL